MGAVDINNYVSKTYFFEMERKHKIHDSFRVYLIILSLCIGHVSFYSTWVIKSGGPLSWTFLSLLVIWIVLMIVSLFLGLVNPEYIQCPTAKELLDKKKQYLEEGNDEKELDKEISNHLFFSMVKCAHVNTYHNKTIGEYVHVFKIITVIYAIVALMSFAPWLYSLDNRTKNNKTDKATENYHIISNAEAFKGQKLINNLNFA